MNLIRLCALALAAELSYGYLDSWPFFMFSTSELLLSPAKLQSASSIISDVSQKLSLCSSDIYILISQPGVNTNDYKCHKTAPALARRVSSVTEGQKDHQIRSSISIPDVIGELDPTRWQDILESKCGVHTTEIDVGAGGSIPTSYEKYPRLIKVYFPAPSKSNIVSELSLNDAFFASMMDLLPSKNYTVMYITSPSQSERGKHSASDAGVEAQEYEMDPTILDQVMHLELKRDMSEAEHQLALQRRQSESNKSNDQGLIDGPLFERYQFFTPAIFMGLLVSLILLSILYVGVSALASLQVTYGAFDKESGQLATKKQ